jgi:hypothetical protein
MAFQMVYESEDGISHPESYWVVDNVVLDKKANVATANFMGYHNKNCRANNKRVVGYKSLVCKNTETIFETSVEVTTDFSDNFSAGALNAVNPYAQSYVYFSADPFFAGALNI